MRTFMVQILKQGKVYVQYMINAENEKQAKEDMQKTITWHGGNKNQYHGDIWEVPYTPNALKL